MGTFPQAMHRRTFMALLGLCGIGFLPGFAHAVENASDKTTSSFSQGPANIRSTNPIIKDGCFNISPREFGSKISRLSQAMNIKDDFFRVLMPECKVAGDGTGLIAIDFTAYESSTAVLDASTGGEGGDPVCRVHCFPTENYRVASDSDYGEVPGIVTAFRCDDLDSGNSGYYVPYVLFLMALLFNPDMPDDLPFILDENLVDYAFDISSRCSDDNMTQQENKSIATVKADSISYTLAYYDDSQTYRALVAVASDNNDGDSASGSSASDDAESSAGPKIDGGYFDISVREFADEMESACYDLGRSSMSFTPVQDNEGIWRIRVDDSNGLFASCIFVTPRGDLIQSLSPDENGIFNVLEIQLLSRSMLEDNLNSQMLVQVVAHVLDPSLTEDDTTEILREIDRNTTLQDNDSSLGHTSKNGIWYVLGRSADGIFTLLVYVDGALDY